MAPTTTPTRAAAAGPGTRARRGLRVPRTLRILAVWLVIALAGATFLSGSTLFLASTAVIYAVFAMGTNIQLGWTGTVSFGQAAFFGAGAYTVGLLAPMQLSPVIGVLLGAAVAALIGLVFSLVTTRVTGVEFTMLTLVFGQILWLLLYRIPGLGGESGLPGIGRGSILGASLFSDDTFWLYACVIAAIAMIGVHRLRNSSFGVGLTAVRDNPGRAAALGIDVRLMRIASFCVAAMFGGLAGALFAQLQGIVSPEVMSWTVSGEVVIMCLIGGVGSYWGPFVGAVLFTVANWALGTTSAAPELYFGLGLLVVVLLLPQGLAGVLPWLRERVSPSRGGASSG